MLYMKLCLQDRQQRSGQSLLPVNKVLKSGILSTLCMLVTHFAEHNHTCLSKVAHGQNCSLHTPVRVRCRSISLTAAELAQRGDMISLWNISEASTLKSC